MDYSEAAKSCLNRKDYAGYFENSRKRYNQTGAVDDKKEMDKAEKTYVLHKEVQEFLKKENSSYYEILGVPRSATQEEIRKAFNILVMKFHPDRNKMDESSAVSGIIQKAYLVLGNPEKRKEYDNKHREGRIFGNPRFRHAGTNGAMPDVFFNTFYRQGSQGPFVYTNQDLYDHLYAHVNRSFGYNEAQVHQSIEGRRVFFVIIVLFLFLLF